MAKKHLFIINDTNIEKPSKLLEAQIRESLVVKNKVKKIAIIDHVGKKAGMDYYSSELANSLTSCGSSVTVYSNFSYLYSNSVSYKSFFNGNTNSNLRKYLNFLLGIFKSSFHAYSKKSDLVILHIFSSNLLSLLLVSAPKIFGLRVVAIAHDINSFSSNDNSLIKNAIYNYLTDKIVVHNKYSRECLLKQKILHKFEKVHVIKHGGYLNLIGKPINPSEARRMLGLDIKKKYLLFFGQIKEAKGLDILLEAMQQVESDVHLIIAGKPWKLDFNYYETLIKKYELQDRIVRFIRFIKDEERKLLFFSADAAILPYRIIYQSGVLLMAMSHNLPVIASDLPANSEIIQNKKNGLLFTSESASALAQSINFFYSHKSLQQTLGQNALMSIKNEYDWKSIAESYLNILE